MWVCTRCGSGHDNSTLGASRGRPTRITKLQNSPQIRPPSRPNTVIARLPVPVIHHFLAVLGSTGACGFAGFHHPSQIHNHISSSYSVRIDGRRWLTRCMNFSLPILMAQRPAPYRWTKPRPTISTTSPCYRSQISPPPNQLLSPNRPSPSSAPYGHLARGHTSPSPPPPLNSTTCPHNCLR